MIKTTTYIVGYGSLVDVESAKKTFGTYHDTFLTEVFGWKRSFSCYGGMNSYSMEKYGVLGGEYDGLEVMPLYSHTYLNVMPDKQATSTMRVYEINKSALPLLDKREANYVRVDIQSLVDFDPGNTEVWMYVAKPEVLIKKDTSKISSFYWDTCKEAHEKVGLGVEFMDQCAEYSSDLIEVKLNKWITHY